MEKIEMAIGKGMQNKTIRKVLDRKIEDWLSSIEDKEVQDLARKNVIITGGSIASMIMGEKINDFDIYMRTKEAALRVAKYYVSKFETNNPNAPKIEVREETLLNIKDEEEDRVIIWVSSAGVAKDSNVNAFTDEEADADENDPDYQEAEIDHELGKYVPVFLSENAITLSNSVQIVTRFYGSPEEIHRNYDYIHACCYYDYHKKILETPVEALRSMQSKTLYYTGSLYPICSLFRLRKFISRGWTISAGDILKIAFQISHINLKDISILKEQLTGVDALYFFQLIGALEDKDLTTIDETYLGEIIDRVFQQNISNNSRDEK